MGIREFIHENKPGLCAVGLIVGLPLTLISALSLWYSEGDTGIAQWANDMFGNWAFWLIIPGLAMAIIGGYYLYDFYRKLKEFKNLMKVESKAKFIKNVDKIEELAWRLHPKYEKIVIEKKKKYKMR